MNDYRHVCFKDLENYLKKTDYFSNFSEEEKEIIRHNLQVPSSSEIFEKGGGIVNTNYDSLKNLVDTNMLSVNCKYVMLDFRTIYKSNTGEIWGESNNPSDTYSLILTPISENQFDPRVQILKDGIALNWIVNYNFTKEQLTDINGGIYYTKGKITYLKDLNNNEAYYDFKNIKFRKLIKNYEIAGVLSDQNLDLYTFSDVNEYPTIKDSSNYNTIRNNKFESDCYENVFLGTTHDNHFYGGFKNNTFLKDCSYNKFEWNTHNNKFTQSVNHTQGTLQHTIVDTTNFDSAVSKEFKMVLSTDLTEPIFVVTKIDGDTLTNQVIKLTKN